MTSYIQKYEVTQGDFETFVKASGHKIKARFYEDKQSESPDRFVSELPAPVSWHDAKAFCRWLGEQSGSDVDLPTERNGSTPPGPEVDSYFMLPTTENYAPDKT